jgi:hypothetical protein
VHHWEQPVQYTSHCGCSSIAVSASNMKMLGDWSGFRCQL